MSVPYGTQGETLVTFYNRIKRGFVKVCKVVQTGSLDALGTTDFTFSVSVGTDSFMLGPIKNGECAISAVDYPILQPNGMPTVVNVTENPIMGVVVTDITYTGSGTVNGASTCLGSISYNLGGGVNVTTFTNAKGVPACG